MPGGGGGGLGGVIGGVASGLIGASASKSASRGQVAAIREQVEEDKRQFDLNREDLEPWRQAGSSAVFKLADLLGIRVAAPPVAPRREDFITKTNVSRNSRFPVGHPFGGGTVEEEIFDQAGFNRARLDYQRSLDTFNNATPSGELLDDFTLEDFEADPGYMFRLSEGNKALTCSGAGRVFDSGATMKDLIRFNQGTASDEFLNAYNRDATNKARKYNFLAGLSGSGQQATNTLVNAGTTQSINRGNALAAAGNARAAGIVGGANAITGGINNAINAYQFDRFLDAYRNAA